MKNGFRYMAWAVGAALIVLSRPADAYGGEINGNEQELLNIISGTENYNGQTYKVKDEYVAQARAYFLQDDVDITDAQKQEAIQKMYGSIGQGVAEGYLEPVGGAPSEKDQSPGKASAPAASSGQQETAETAAPETAPEPEPEPDPIILALQEVSRAEERELVRDFPLEKMEKEYPLDAVLAAAGAALICLALGAGTALRSGLFHHHHRKGGKQK